MRNALRMFIVGLVIVGLSVNPAVACHWCGGGYYSSYAPIYYGGYGDCGGGCDDGCGGCEVDYHDDCGGCDSCGEAVVDEGVVVEHGREERKQEQPPQPPSEMPAETQPRQPATVERPAETEMTPPALPPQSETTPPAELPPAETPAEAPGELFGPEAPAEAPPAETAPATEPAAPTETPETPPGDDDLFGGESTDAAPAESAPAESPTETPAAAPAEGEKADEEDDLFGSARGVLREAGGLASNEMRVWVDNTGKYSVNARLIRFIDGRVRLMKDSGRTTTVPLDRLSERDLQFVNRQASARKATTMQTAQADAPSIGFAN